VKDSQEDRSGNPTISGGGFQGVEGNCLEIYWSSPGTSFPKKAFLKGRSLSAFRKFQLFCDGGTGGASLHNGCVKFM